MSFQDKGEIRKVFEDVYPSNVRTGDLDGYADMYTEDACWMPPGAVVRRGKVDIVKGFAAQIVTSEIDPTFMAEEIQVIGDFGYVIGMSQAKIRSKENGKTKDATFRAMWLMQKEQGTWKIARQIWNS
jgi:uncharacterized protein (TIGR02246 family)